jgi:hypothetical protein
MERNVSGSDRVAGTPVTDDHSSAQTATISGLLGIDAGPILDNSGYFSQVLAAPYVANKRYTFGADISTGGALGLGALSAAHVGIALRAGSTVLADSATAPAGLVTLTPLAGNDYRLTLVYDTGGTVSGNIGVQLFNIPQGLLTAALVPSVAFANVTLNQGAITDADTQLHVSGIGSQSAEVGTPFASPLEAIVTDGGGTPLEGVIVTLSAPTSGASAVLSSGSASGYIIETVSDSDGTITVSATANAIAGCYTVNASVPGSPSRAVFHLRNWSTAQMSGFLYAGYDPFGVAQDSIFCDGFD